MRFLLELLGTVPEECSNCRGRSGSLSEIMQIVTSAVCVFCSSSLLFCQGRRFSVAWRVWDLLHAEFLSRREHKGVYTEIYKPTSVLTSRRSFRMWNYIVSLSYERWTNETLPECRIFKLTLGWRWTTLAPCKSQRIPKMTHICLYFAVVDVSHRHCEACLSLCRKTCLRDCNHSCAFHPQARALLLRILTRSWPCGMNESEQPWYCCYFCLTVIAQLVSLSVRRHASCW